MEIAKDLATLSVVRALLDQVTPSLRGVLLNLKDSGLDVHLLYAVDANDDIDDIVLEVEASMAADFSPQIDIIARASRVPASSSRDDYFDVRRGDLWVFRRRE